ncbi:hypothetical protein GPALN_005570 [Globodera pallida]|nr:hypothetical protein GPALN_005570 [Globodera pallida]
MGGVVVVFDVKAEKIRKTLQKRPSSLMQKDQFKLLRPRNRCKIVVASGAFKYSMPGGEANDKKRSSAGKGCGRAQQSQSQGIRVETQINQNDERTNKRSTVLSLMEMREKREKRREEKKVGDEEKSKQIKHIRRRLEWPSTGGEKKKGLCRAGNDGRRKETEKTIINAEEKAINISRTEEKQSKFRDEGILDRQKGRRHVGLVVGHNGHVDTFIHSIIHIARAVQQDAFPSGKMLPHKSVSALIAASSSFQQSFLGLTLIGS